MEKSSFAPPLFRRLAVFALLIVLLQAGLSLSVDYLQQPADSTSQHQQQQLKQQISMLSDAIVPMLTLDRWEDASPLLDLLSSRQAKTAAYLYRVQQNLPILVAHTQGLPGFDAASALNRPQPQSGFLVEVQQLEFGGTIVGSLMLVKQLESFDWQPM